MKMKEIVIKIIIIITIFIIIIIDDNGNTVLTNRICTNQKLFQEMTPIKFSEMQIDPSVSVRRPDLVLI